MTMKHPPENIENFEFNIGKAPELRCVNWQVTTTCNECECCRVRILLIESREWFPRAGEHTKRRFVLGLVRRFHSVQLLQYIIMILKPLIGKDYTYARSRTNPSIAGDGADMGCDRALTSSFIDENIANVWTWFKEAKYWSKANYMLGLLQFCDGNLLHTIGTQARTMLAAELKAAEGFNNYDDEDDTESLADTVHSYNTWDHPENKLLRHASKEYTDLSSESSPFSIIRSGSSTAEEEVEGEEDVLDPDHVTVEDEGDDADDGHDHDSDGNSIESEDDWSVDPRIPIMPTAKSAIGGIKPYVDFVRELPIHISKYILSHLEYAELVSCCEVSRHWEHVGKSVEEDHRMRQLLWEEVMLMQGSSAQGGNPVYASYIDVPVPELVGDSHDPLLSDDPPQEDVQFKTEININNSYSGIVTRDVQMEERNVYCGAYNVMVLSDQEDFNRVVHFNYGHLVPVGSFDRHVRLVDIGTGHDVGPLITGHAGSVKCVFINEAKGFVLSGSYDTSIRCWDIETGRPTKIFHGHQATILCMDMYEDILVSGAKDNEVKVWNFLSGKCFRTFKHKAQINTVAVYGDTVVSGCEEGKVKMWSIKEACLIKALFLSPKVVGRFGFPNPHTHQGPITCVKVDQYHIASGSQDGYAMIWSIQGNIKKCISALRHPKEVLCLGMMYLRLVTGCEDGKIRIWNMLSGDCLRVMRGNSRSDPINALFPCGDSMVLLTMNNFLVLNFEEVQWDYEQEEKIELLRYKNHYGDAPLRKHSYAYVRAQRSQRAGTVNPKIINHRSIKSAPANRPDTSSSRHWQLPHSTRTLSTRRINSARQTQRNVVNVELTNSLKGRVYHNVQGNQPEHYDESMRAGIAQTLVISRGKGLASLTAGSRPPTAATHRPPTGIRAMTAPALNNSDRRLSTARVKAAITATNRPSTVHISSGTMPSSSSTKQTMTARPHTAGSGAISGGSITAESQIQTSGIVNPRSTSPLANSRPPTGIMKSGIVPRPSTAGTSGKKTKFQLPMRGHSAPVRRCQPSDALSLSEAKAIVMSHRRTMNEPTPRDRLLLTMNCIESSKLNTHLVNNTTANCLEIDYKPISDSSNSSETWQSRPGSSRSSLSFQQRRAKPSEVITKQTMITPLSVTRHDIKVHRSIHPNTVHSHIPRGNIIRPQSANTRVTDVCTVEGRAPPEGTSLRRSQSTGSLSSMKDPLTSPYIASPVRKKKSHGWSTSHTEPIEFVPMLMHGPGHIDPKASSTNTHITLLPNTKTTISMVPAEGSSRTKRSMVPHRPVQDPMNITESNFQIRSRQQTEDYLKYVSGIQAKYERNKKAAGLRKQQQMWMAKATGNLKNNGNVRPRVISP